VRLYNQTPRKVRGRIEWAFPAKGVWLTDLSEKTLAGQTIRLRPRRLTLDVPGKKIITLAIRF